MSSLAKINHPHINWPFPADRQVEIRTRAFDPGGVQATTGSVADPELVLPVIDPIELKNRTSN